MRPGLLRLFFLGVIGVCVFSTGAMASPNSLDLEKQGMAALERQEWAPALGKFEEAAQADPADGRALFLIGVALNRMEHFPEALINLSTARDHFSHPEMDFELGLAYMGTKLYHKSIAALERYEKKHPGRGQTQEIMGRSYIGLEKYDLAEAALKAARERDPLLEPAVRDLLAVIEEERGSPKVALPPEKAVTPANPSQNQGGAKADDVHVTILAAGGYNDNVIALGNSIPLPSDITNKGSAYEHLSLDVGRMYDLKNNEWFSIGYALMADRYHRLSQVNLLDHLLTAEFLKAFTPKRSGSIRLSDEYTTVGGNRFRNQLTLRPALSMRFTPDSVTEFALGYSSSDYLFTNTVPTWDRDGNSLTPAVTHFFLSKGKPLGSIGYAHTWNHANGADFDFQADALSLAASRDLGHDFTGEISYRYTDFRYDHANSLSLTGSSRRDSMNDWSGQILKKLRQNVNMFIQYQVQRTTSNIPYYSFIQKVWNIGMIATF